MRHVLYSTSSVSLAILIIGVLLLSLTGFVHADTVAQFLSATTTATTTASTIPIATSGVACFSGSQNLSVTMHDSTNPTAAHPVHDMQQFLKDQGYMTIDPTGYFGTMTLDALKHFQQDNHITPTGYFGPITQQAFRDATCQKQWSPITVISPASGDILVRNSNVNIIWNVFMPQTFAAGSVPQNQASYTITLAPVSSCKPGVPCPLLAIKPYTLATNLSSHGFYRISFAWIVGNNLEVGRMIPAGQYRVNICPTDGTTCTQSDIFSIVDATTTVH